MTRSFIHESNHQNLRGRFMTVPERLGASRLGSSNFLSGKCAYFVTFFTELIGLKCNT